MPTEGELQRICSPLYSSIALESFGAVFMGFVFSYLLLLITNKGRLSSPGRAASNYVWHGFSSYVKEVWENTKKWPYLTTAPVLDRFAFCRKTNQAVCAIQVLIALLTITRWLHVGNVNGFRYLGYAITCPPMQAQLVILIGPAVPFYKFTVVMTFLLTFAMLIAGYAASLYRGDIYTGSINTFMDTGNIDDLGLTSKFWWLLPSMACQIWLSFVHVPYLLLLYCIGGGVKGGLPWNYIRLLAIVGITWLSFPAWWLLSFEGLSIITDTKMNGMGFACLNIISKGMFTMQILRMSGWHRRQAQKESKKEEAINAGVDPLKAEQEAEDALEAEAQEQDIFTAANTIPVQAIRPDEGQQAVSRPATKKETWIVTALRDYDDFATSQAKEELDAAFQCFLLGAGHDPDTYDKLPHSKQVSLREKFDQMSEHLTTALESAAVPVKDHPEAILEEDEEDAHSEGSVESESLFV